MQSESKTIWTIGHSTRSFDEFLTLLSAHNIEVLADIRSFPGSRRFPHFNKENLSLSLPEHGITYIHLPRLGGRRKPVEGSVNSAWRNDAFRGYADYMQSGDFKEELDRLLEIAATKRTAYMCSEAPWWKCHRALVSDFLKVRGWRVWHIMEKGRLAEHPYTSAARAVQGELFYN